MIFRLFFLSFALALFITAQSRDFLTAAEVDQIRLVQEPNERIQLYLSFAKQRVELIRQAVAQSKPGSSKFVHDLLEDYTKIIESIDTVSDDALRRKVDISLGAKAIVDANKDLLTELEKIRDSQPKDVSRYEFALDQAIEATRDSGELASEDLSKRSSEVLTRAKKEQQQRESMMKTEDLEAKKEAAKKETETKRKPPTLRRKGELPKEP